MQMWCDRRFTAKCRTNSCQTALSLLRNDLKCVDQGADGSDDRLQVPFSRYWAPCVQLRVKNYLLIESPSIIKSSSRQTPQNSVVSAISNH